MGFLGEVSELRDRARTPRSHDGKLQKYKQLQRVEIKVKMDCEGCVRSVKKSVQGMKGVTNVEADPKQSKLTVTGYVDPNEVLQRVRQRTGKKAVFWPYIRIYPTTSLIIHTLLEFMITRHHMRNVLQDPEAAALARACPIDVRYTTAFSNENPNASR